MTAQAHQAPRVIVECEGCDAIASARTKGSRWGRIPSLPQTWGTCGMSNKRHGQAAYWCQECVRTGRFNDVLTDRQEPR